MNSELFARADFNLDV